MVSHVADFHCSILSVQTLYKGFCSLIAKAIAGVNDDEDPPVPIPNTVVKLISAENTWMETSWENRSVPAPLQLLGNSQGVVLFYVTS